MSDDLFATDVAGLPLAARMRPVTLDEYIGQGHLIGEGKPLRNALESGHIHSMILWGPPGTGKTTLARMIAHYSDSAFITLSAVLSGVKEIREAVVQSRTNRQLGRQTILFVDEVHRFNKSQQDAFLPHVEDGTIVFIGATTENPSFEINNALLSRARVYVLKRLGDADLVKLLARASTDSRFTQDYKVQFGDDVLLGLAHMADGDARRALNTLELSAEYAQSENIGFLERWDQISAILGHQSRRFDKQGDVFYDQISALHKSVRGSSPDGALYWFCRMLDGGCDPLYIARRLVRMASEDVGNADPRALDIALNAWDVQERLGSPEGELALAQALVYLACAPKSNAVYSAFKQAMEVARQSGSIDVPTHLRNAPTALMKEQGFGDGYRYAHDEPLAYAAGESYLPESLCKQQFYYPVERGLELKIREKLAYFRSLDQHSNQKRYPDR